MKRIAIIKAGKVSQIIERPAPLAGEVDVTGTSVGPGWLYDGQDFTAPDTSKPLTKTQFMDHAVAQLGGIAEFQTLMEACQDSTDATYGPTLRYAYSRYDAAEVLSKDKVGELSSVMVAAGLLTSQDRAAVLDNWPT